MHTQPLDLGTILLTTHIHRREPHEKAKVPRRLWVRVSDNSDARARVMKELLLPSQRNTLNVIFLTLQRKSLFRGSNTSFFTTKKPYNRFNWTLFIIRLVKNTFEIYLNANTNTSRVFQTIHSNTMTLFGEKSSLITYFNKYLIFTYKYFDQNCI